MLTADIIEGNRILALECDLSHDGMCHDVDCSHRFLWADTVGCSRPPSTYRTLLRLDLISRQGGMCPICGNGLTNPQFNHVISRGPKVRGFVPLNVFAGCALCNLSCAMQFGAVADNGNIIDGGVIPIEAFSRPDIVPSEWTPVITLKAMARANR